MNLNNIIFVLFKLIIKDFRNYLINRLIINLIIKIFYKRIIIKNVFILLIILLIIQRYIFLIFNIIDFNSRKELFK